MKLKTNTRLTKRFYDPMRVYSDLIRLISDRYSKFYILPYRWNYFRQRDLLATIIDKNYQA